MFVFALHSCSYHCLVSLQLLATMLRCADTLCTLHLHQSRSANEAVEDEMAESAAKMKQQKAEEEAARKALAAKVCALWQLVAS